MFINEIKTILYQLLKKVVYSLTKLNFRDKI